MHPFLRATRPEMNGRREPRGVVQRTWFNVAVRISRAARNMIKSVCEKNEIDVILKIVKVDFTEVKEFCLIKRE